MSFTTDCDLQKFDIDVQPSRKYAKLNIYKLSCTIKSKIHHRFLQQPKVDWTIKKKLSKDLLR